MDLRSAHKAAEKSPGHLHLSLTHTLDPEAGHAAQKFCSEKSGVYRQLVHHKRKKRNLKHSSVEDWEELENDDNYEEEVVRQEETETDMAILNSEYGKSEVPNSCFLIQYCYPKINSYISTSNKVPKGYKCKYGFSDLNLAVVFV